MRRLTPNRGRAVATDVDVAGLEGWLRSHPPQSLVPLADRLLIAAVDRSRSEGPALAAATLPALVVAAQQAEAAHHLTTLAVCLACADDLGHDSADLRFALAVITKAVDVDGQREPFRSTSRYWLWRAALRAQAPVVDVADAPSDRLLAFMFHSHRVLFASGYGAVPVAADVGGFAEANALVDLDDGDQVALLLLCHASVTPRAASSVEERPASGSVATVADLRARLASLQVKNGSLRTRLDDPVARHHAVCVATLACSLLKR